MIYVNVDFAFDIMTPDGTVIAEDIAFKAVLTAQECRPEPDVGMNEWHFEDITFDECQIESLDYTCWRELPKDLEPAFQRWLDHKDNAERIAEWFCDAMEGPDDYM